MMSDRDEYGYPCQSRVIDELSWFYEQRDGLWIVNEPITGARTTTIKIPWRRLEAAVDHHRKVKARRKTPHRVGEEVR
jgi:hypothetical protein